MSFQVRRSSQTGRVPTSLQPGELAANTADGRVWVGLENGLIMEVGAGGGQRTGEQVLIFGSLPGTVLACDGSAVSRSQYAALFACIGISYGAGNSVSTFNLPDKRMSNAFSPGISYAGQSLSEAENREHICIFV